MIKVYLCNQNHFLMRQIHYFLYFLLLIMASCSGNSDLMEQMNRIKAVGDTNPDSAMNMLNSIQGDIANGNEYVKYKAELLSVRLNDKAFNVPESDEQIRRILGYFESGGHDEDMQEVYYYAGSVYRDLDDVPNALIYFNYSNEWAERSDDADSVMIRNAYSQLRNLFFSVQDYQNALLMARKENEIARKLNILDAMTMLGEGNTLLRIDSTEQAIMVFKNTLKLIGDVSTRQDSYAISSLLYDFSSTKCRTEADECYRLFQKVKSRIQQGTANLSLAAYYKLTEQMDSAILCYKEILEGNNDLASKYDAARNLSVIYHERGDMAKMDKYAAKFIVINDSLNLGERQKQAATTNNKYKYQKNKEEELSMKAEKEHYKMLLVIVVALSLVAIAILYAYFTYKKNLRLKEYIEKTRQLNELTELHLKLEKDIETDKRLRAESAVEVAEVVRRINEIADSPKESLPEDYWDIIFNTVDKLHPHFREHVLSYNNALENKDLIIIYLMKLGYKQADVARITKKARSVISRKCHRIEDMLCVSITEVIGG